MRQFSTSARAELARIYPAEDCCARAEFGGMLRAGGSLVLLGQNRFSIALETEHADVARKALRLLKRLTGLPVAVVVEDHGQLHRRVYHLQLEPGTDAKRLLARLDLPRPEEGIDSEIPASLVRRECCRSAFLRGAYLLCGSVCDPRRASYHLEMVTSTEEFGLGLVYLLNLARLKAHLAPRKGKQVVYIKDVDDIGGFLSLIQAHAARLELEEVRVLKEVRGGVNRLVNAETANLDKSVKAALEQVQLIEALKERKGLGFLPHRLRQLAQVRLEHPEASLAELGQLLPEPASKSAVNHRLRKLRRLAMAALEMEER